MNRNGCRRVGDLAEGGHGDSPQDTREEANVATKEAVDFHGRLFSPAAQCGVLLGLGLDQGLEMNEALETQAGVLPGGFEGECGLVKHPRLGRVTEDGLVEFAQVGFEGGGFLARQPRPGFGAFSGGSERDRAAGAR
jgi:hypothetical protein